MNRHGTAALIVAAAALILSQAALSQMPVPVRRAQPVDEPPVARAVPFDTPPPASTSTIRSLPVPNDAVGPPPFERQQATLPAVEGTESSPEQRQLNYANALFGRKTLRPLRS